MLLNEFVLKNLKEAGRHTDDQTKGFIFGLRQIGESIGYSDLPFKVKDTTLVWEVFLRLD